MHFTIWTEKREGRGEDAPPTLWQKAPAQTLLAVYDGMGGAGSKIYSIPEANGQTVQLSGAFLGARLARRSLEDFFAHTPISQDSFAEALAQRLREDLQLEAQQLEHSPSRLKSKLIKTLPSTLAGAHIWSDEPRQMQVFWAGDSRIYLLSPRLGLQQLSRDDLNGHPDALENLWQDATLSNCLAAEGNFQIHYRSLPLELPSLVFCATDGCFAYLASPMHFEYFLLQSLMNSYYDPEDWREKLQDVLHQHTADDLSLSLAAFGFDNLNALKNQFFPRYQFLYQNYIAPWESWVSQHPPPQEPEEAQRAQYELEKRTLLSQLWQTYQRNYYV